MTAPAPLSASNPVFISSVKKVNRAMRPVAANAVTYQGGIAVANPGGSAPGYYGEATGAPGEIVVGRFYGTYGAVSNTGGAAGAKFAEIQFFRERFLFLVNNDTVNPVTAAQRETMVSILNDNCATVDAGQPAADMGLFYDFSEDGSGMLWVEFPFPSSSEYSSLPVASAVGKARCVITALPGAYTGSAGVLTANANGALPAQQGVTLAAGDVAWLEEGATNIGTAADGGPVVVVQAGSSSTPYILARTTWWAQGSTIPVGSEVTIGLEDTLYGGSKWHTGAAKGAVVGTNAPAGYPDKVEQVVTMAAAAAVITNVPVRTANGIQVIANLKTQAGTSTGIVRYGEVAASTIAGHLGTASVTVQGFLAANVVATPADTSTVKVTILQQ